MFDKLIESEPHSADFRDRRGYFMISSVVVGILFLAAVVISIYAEDFNLGNGSLEMSELIAPVEMAAIEPEPIKPRTQSAPASAESTIPTRREIISRTDEPTIVPTDTSTVANNTLSRPIGPVELSDRDTDPIGTGRTDPGPKVSDLADTPAVAEKDPIPDPPAVKDPPPVRKPPIPSLGVINGRAISLPKPQYSPAAIALNAQGKVDVQVMIDESGKVVSANAVNGHPILRNLAEQAARNARFSPTLLSNVPVKVTGVIAYNFRRN